MNIMNQTEEKSNKLITVSGVTGYIDENGVAQLRLEDVARGLGFVTVATSGNEVVRWSRVNKYLSDFDFIPTSGDGYVPENIFYRLAFKANNKVATNFQKMVADVILPAIRKTGSYSVRPMTAAEILVEQAQQFLQMERRVMAIETKYDQAVEVLTESPELTWRDDINSRINGMCKAHGLNYQQFRHDLYQRLEEAAACNLESRKSRLQGRMKTSGATYRERQEITKLHVIEKDQKLKAIFEGIVRKYQLKYPVNNEKVS